MTAALKAAERAGPLAISIIVAAELHARPGISDNLDDLLARLSIAIEPIDVATAKRAGRAHGEYRRNGGERTTIIADFLIGAHAAVLGIPLITRDRQRFASYFPELTIIAPESSA